MKKILATLCILVGMTIPVSAVNYCASTSWGYAGTSVTGGGNATPMPVTNEDELIKALSKSDRVIIIAQDIMNNHQLFLLLYLL